MELVKRENAMSKKPTGLAAFTRGNSTIKPDREAVPDSQTAASTERERGKGNLVALTVRLSRADWERVHQLAVSEGVSIQKLAVRGLSKIFAEKGLPTLTE